MIIKRFYDDKLAQASYLIACENTHEALVIDPLRDVSEYLDAAKEDQLSIVAVTETHIHADYVSGSRELSHATGATIYLSGEGAPDWLYRYVNDPNVIVLHNGDIFNIGKILIKVLHTPGHTPEHLSFLVTDSAKSENPLAVFSGDFLFVGDVGRPDLLERAAKLEGTMEKGARDLYRSLASLKMLSDYLIIWPGHGAGSVCGKSLGAVPATTLGYEKLTNWAFHVKNEADFISEVLQGQPAPPKYFANMKQINKKGPKILNGLPILQPINHKQFTEALQQGATVLDVRSDEEFAKGFLQGSINIPVEWKSFTTWCGWLISYDKPIYLIANDHKQAKSACRNLILIGLDSIRGWLSINDSNDIPPHSTISTIESKELFDKKDYIILDVRNQSEYANGHIPGSVNIPLGELPERVNELPKNKSIAVHCGSGGRSAIAASILNKSEFPNVVNVSDGFQGYVRLNLPVELSYTNS
jgi:hydroxyacylglutathione hydrolase